MPHHRQYHESPLGFGLELFSFPYGKFIFVMARPKTKDWSEYDGCSFKRGRADWRPVMVTGHGCHGQHVRVAGSTSSYPTEDFEFGKIIVDAKDENYV